MPAAQPLPNGNNATPPFPSNPMLLRNQSQWLFTPVELKRAPSILDGMPIAQEQSNRSKGVNFITQVGILLKLPQLTLATASVYLHRFFMRYSMVDLPHRPGLHHYALAATALFLATKVEENCRKMRELVVACCRVAQKQPNLVVDEQNKEYWKWRDTILHNEDVLLEALCFDLQLEQPYKILFDFLCYYGVQDNKHLRNTAWAYMNDSNLTTMCLLFSARAIAGSALYAGAKFAVSSFPDDEWGRPWWEHLGLDIAQLRDACNLMAEVYENSVLPRQAQKELYVRDEETAPYTRTRRISSPTSAQSPAGSAGTDSHGVKREREEEEDRGNDENGGFSSTIPHRSESSQSQSQYLDGVPSSKRQRRESSPGSTFMQQSSNGPVHVRQGYSSTNNVHQNGSSNSVDEVQQRIDDIINASSSVRSSQNAYARPPTSRGNSQTQQQPPWPGPPARGRTLSVSNRPRPPSRQESDRDGQRPPSRQDDDYLGRQRSISQQRSYRDEDDGSRTASHDLDRQISHESLGGSRRNGDSQRTAPSLDVPGEVAEEEEQAGSGSEEGEL